MVGSTRTLPKWPRSRAATGLAVAVIVTVLGAGALLAGVTSGRGSAPTPAASGMIALDPTTDPGLLATASSIPIPTLEPTPKFPPIELFVPTNQDGTGKLIRPDFWVDQRRPIPVQSLDWLAVKAAGRVALVNGAFTVLPKGTDPLVDTVTGSPVPDKTIMETEWARWIIEVPGTGRDEKGVSFSNNNYWEFCGDGAMTVALWYWQQRTGHPNVTGMAGQFVDPYDAEGVAWPNPGPRNSKGMTYGTYWSGSDKVSGFEAHGRGFEFYLAMAARPTGWLSPGFTVFALDGKALYPALGTPITNIGAGLNWEASGHAIDWGETYYTIVTPRDPNLARDLTTAVMIDVGRDRVPVVAMVDTNGLPNWQNGTATPHTRHAVAIVGYDNTANPPTFTYTETCGRDCNRRGGNMNGDLHVISQAQMVNAIVDKVGSGFVW